MSSSFKAPAEAAKAVAATGGIKNNSPIVNCNLALFLSRSLYCIRRFTC